MKGPLHLVASGVSTHAGDAAYASFGAIGLKIVAAVPEPAVTMPGPGGDEKPALKVPTRESSVPVEATPDERIEKMLIEAFSAALAELPSERIDRETQVHLILPPGGTQRSRLVTGAGLRQRLSSDLPALAKCQWSWSRADEGAVTALDELAAQPWKLLLLAGADSLIDTATLLGYGEAERLMVEGGRQGLMPGEAAAAVALVRPDDPIPARALLTGWRGSPEPHVGRAEEQPLKGLAMAIEGAVEGAGLKTEEISAVYHGLGTELSGDLEWYQVQQRHWPGRAADEPPRQQRSALVFGEVGAAGLPLHLAVAAAGLEYAAELARFGFPRPGPVLACETPDAPVRGAVCLAWPETTTEPRR